MKYRKKPVIVEAFKLGIDDMPRWASDAVNNRNKMRIFSHSDGTIFCRIATLEGIMRAEIGDYIIQGVQGELYPCKPDIFEQTYEAVSE